MVTIRLTAILWIIFCWCIASAQYNVDSLNALYETTGKFSAIPRPLDKNAPEHDPRLPDMSIEGIRYRQAFWEDVQRKIKRVDEDALQDQDRINYDVFKYIVEDHVAGFKYHTYLMPFNAEGGFHTEFGFLPGYHAFNTIEDYEDYLMTLGSFPEYVDQHLVLLREAMRRGYTMPCIITENVQRTAEAYMASDVTESVFYRPFSTIPESIVSHDELRLRGREIVGERVIPAYRRLYDFLRDEYLSSCRSTIGASALPDGKAYYNQRVKYFTTLDMTADEIFAIGQKEVTRIRAEMQLIIDSLGFDGDYADFLQFLRTDQRFYAKTPRELLAEASYICKRIDGRLPEYFGKLPRLPYGVEPVPMEIAPRYTSGRYSQGSYKDHRAGNYWVNTTKLESRPLYTLTALTLHEAVPGHHLQISLAAEAELDREIPLPTFRTSYISAFGEGWALYTEWLGKEMGIYEDQFQRFGALTYEMWRACRLVVDPGMHAFGWTREQALEFMSENTALSHHEIDTEIDRYIGWPGQAVSYKIGELKIRALRNAAEEELGEKFDLREFHDLVLENGSVPLFVLERVVKEWIKQK